MFKKNESNQLGKLDTIIGTDTVFQGNIKTKSAVRIDGKLEGNITEASGVVIGDKGSVSGDVNSKVVVVSGKVTGNITAFQNLEILSKAQVYGDIHTALLSIGEGAVFEGNCVMNTEANKVIEMDVASRRK